MPGWNHEKLELKLRNFEDEIIILPLATEADMKNRVASKKMCIIIFETLLILIFFGTSNKFMLVKKWLIILFNIKNVNDILGNERRDTF